MNEYEKYNFREIEEKYNFEFDDKDLLVRAFTHGSYNKEALGNYQRMEFLGDAVLQMVMSDYMYRFYSTKTEGDMSKERGALVSEVSLADIIRREGLDKFILFGNSLNRNEIKNTNSYISDVYESFVAAIYLDRGYNAAEDYIKKTLIEYKDDLLENDLLKDYKTELQEILQVNGSIIIKYETEDSSDKDGFNAKVFLEGSLIGEGFGKNKKQAEQQAAKSALLNRV